MRRSSRGPVASPRTRSSAPRPTFWHPHVTPGSRSPWPPPTTSRAGPAQGCGAAPDRRTTRSHETSTTRASKRGRSVTLRQAVPAGGVHDRLLAPHGHPGPAEVPIDRSGPRSRISTSAVTVKVAKRSASGPDTAGASGPGLAPPPGAARSILQVARSAYRPRTATAAGCCGPSRLVERCKRAARIRIHQAGSSASQPSLSRPPALADRHVMSARSEPACSAIASPMGSFTERPG